ncbi:MAG: replication-relaxation family protein [Bryobacteraceae bacterium]|nr:replication-relaxation family protein [Bryobacteraceae bacterium]
MLEELASSPLLTSQVARLLGFPSVKKASQRLVKLYRAGHARRLAFFQASMHGTAEFVYFIGAAPHARTLGHTLAVAEVHVLFAEWLRRADVAGEFWYGSQLQLGFGVMPDGVIVLERGEKRALLFLEVDRGTEPLARQRPGYSLRTKLTAYAGAFDSGAYAQDFAWRGEFRGFRVLLIVPRGRVRHLQRLLRAEQFDFVLLSTLEDLQDGIDRPVWVTGQDDRVNWLGHPGDAPGEQRGEQSGPPLPTQTPPNLLKTRDVAPQVLPRKTPLVRHGDGR